MKAIELRQLRYFSILARELHFGRAADLASITQSALSQQIAKLEELVGAQLLNRDRRGVTLTASGEALRNSADAIFAQVERALREAQDAAGSRESRLSIGLVEYANLPFIPPALIRLQTLYPDITIERHEMNTAQQITALTKKQIDIGFGVLVDTAPDNDDVLVQPLFEADWVLLMRSDHRLANVDCLNLCDLAQERLIGSARAVNAPLYDSMVAQFQQAGFTPNFIYETTQVQVGVTLIEQGLGAMIGTTYLFSSLPKTLRYRQINGLEPVTVQMLSRTNERNSLILDFLDLAAEEARCAQTRATAPRASSR
ncbi:MULTISPECIES: LysR substrate-binding domain-containing protein [Paraburkholderia]|uniref:LysR substrate-binding domain-containing protein n=1 Tax=Paraburkholderia TaxID=1822464 RepID=UPI0015C57EBE|nr:MULTISPECIES: LysR substrate-binding domain-containing protein [Paraburkholderia]MCX4173885.1 LysR substrate-binding domain-containing protein [Paraburkholderia madseniana]MDQ6461889.1 LysR substrate-binding domain-containing protein [Paraburkholderia madseniana]NPT68107.1 LysR family transcriptional regulator [Paraburkholderia madseniana]